MSSPRQTLLASRPTAVILALSMVAGLSAPFLALPPLRAEAITPNGTTELSATPVDQTSGVSPNIVVTFDNSDSMLYDYMGDTRPFGGGGFVDAKGIPLGPWYCAGVIDPTATSGIGTHVMNGVYYNPNTVYERPRYADGSLFPPADANLTAVANDGIAANMPNSSTSDGVMDFSNGTDATGNTTYWQCPEDIGHPYMLNTFLDTSHKPIQRVTGGGPYYYQLKASALNTLKGQLESDGTPDSNGIATLYNKDNWEAVPVPKDQYQNWANWWAYYRTRSQMARTAMSRAFGSPTLAGDIASGGYGSHIRVAWQTLFPDDPFHLQNSTIISALIDQKPYVDCRNEDPSIGAPATFAVTNDPPPCYRSAFFNWIFLPGPPQFTTPSRSATIRAGEFFMRGKGDTGATGDLHDPYWQPPATGTFDATSNPGYEPYCRQNFHMLVTDGVSYDDPVDDPEFPATQSSTGLPDVSANAGSAFKNITQNLTLPDGVTYSSTAAVSRIFWNQDGDTPASMANIAFNYWATDLRPDLYLQGDVTPSLPDLQTNLFPGAGNVSGDHGTAANIPQEEYFNPNNDPATWPHMEQYVITLGSQGQLSLSDDYDCEHAPNAACDLRKGNVRWPAFVDNTITGVDDVWHSTVTGRGRYFNASDPEQFSEQLANVLSQVSTRSTTATPSATNASVATIGALSFETTSTADWSGTFDAVTLNADGTIDNASAWPQSPGYQLDHRAPGNDRKIYSDAYNGSSLSRFEFTTANVGSITADAYEKAGLGPAIATTTDTAANRIDYLRGDHTHESDHTYRARAHLLGAIIHSQPVYVGYPTGNYYNNWPANSPEALAAAASTGSTDRSYPGFLAHHGDRPPTVYLGANDGMLHAFNAPVPNCTSYDVSTGVCAHYDYGTNPGREDWAFIPRAVYANLGNLTVRDNFHFRPTVDATPVFRDVFFDGVWNTILVGGVGVGGRGVYALNITDPSVFGPSNVLWEFDSDMAVDSSCISNFGHCQGTDLGYTVSQPNIGRLKYHKQWVVLVPNGYFPDCSKLDIPTADKASCEAVASQAPKDSVTGDPYSALFVLDAKTGQMIAELKTPTGLTVGGVEVTSFGLATPVMGDQNADQIDDVAFAGDLEGNLWRFDLSEPNPHNWKVTLVYRGLADASGNQGLQPITTMPRLFPDPATNRFMVVFGTGKYLGAEDNGSSVVQAIYGIRDAGACATADGCAVVQTQLVKQTLGEHLLAAPNPYAGATVRTLTDNAVPIGNKGWYINLQTFTSDGAVNDTGERVVVTPGAIFSNNSVIVQTLITGASGSDLCHPSNLGAVMVINANNGGPGEGISSLGGGSVVGGRITNAHTSGGLPVVSALGGGQFYIPGAILSGTTSKAPFAGDAPIWRRRSWQEPNQQR